MNHKYQITQRVKIVEVREQHGNLKYPSLKEHVNKKGEILEIYTLPMKGFGELEGYRKDINIYTIKLESGMVLESVVEEALSLP